jgi:chromosomal replication initiator protein
MELVHARQEAMYRLRTEKNLSLSAIGRELGKRDHTTVIHGIKQHKKRI